MALNPGLPDILVTTKGFQHIMLASGLFTAQLRARRRFVVLTALLRWRARAAWGQPLRPYKAVPKRRASFAAPPSPVLRPETPPVSPLERRSSSPAALTQALALALTVYPYPDPEMQI